MKQCPFRKIILLIIFSILPLQSFASGSYADSFTIQARYPFDIIFTVDADKFYGYFDRQDVFFDSAASDIKHAGYGGNLGLELIQAKGFGVHFLAGYQRLWYTDIGFAQVAKNYLSAAILFSHYFTSTSSKWSPFVKLGPVVLISEAGNQGYLQGAIGVRYMFGENWSYKIELSPRTDFTGIRGQLGFGLNYHFP